MLFENSKFKYQKNLLSLSSMTISEIASATKLEESEVEKVSIE